MSTSNYRGFAAILLLLAAFYLPASNSQTPVVAQTVPSFSFAAAGDLGGGANATASLDRLAAAGTSFFVALGDLSYSAIIPEAGWCDYVKIHVGATYPFQLITGNHEDENILTDDGFINNFTACLPDRLGSVGDYGHQYYFDYPLDQPLARFILIDADLIKNGAVQSYCKGGETTNCNWLKTQIDEAKAQGLWVIVGMHKNCITLGIKTCTVGAELFNLLFESRVDLILQGHEHNYQRSKQLICGVVDSYNPACVADDGSDNQYVRGAGTVLVIDGTFGKSLVDVNPADPEAGYFVSWMGYNSNARKGFVKFTVSASQISAEFVGSTSTSTFTDNFTIVDLNLPTPTPPAPNFPDTAHPPQSLRPVFDWDGAPGAKYTLQISTSRDFQTMLVSINLSPSAYLTTTDLPRGTTLYWRVRTIGPNGSSDWSAIKSFDTPDPPNAPVLLTPNGGLNVSSRTPTLDWTDVSPAPQRYEVQIATDRDFVNVLGRGQGGPTAQSQYTPEFPLAAATTYFWRVSAFGGASPSGQLLFSGWSATGSFTTPP
jgi:hypothetical protein